MLPVDALWCGEGRIEGDTIESFQKLRFLIRILLSSTSKCSTSFSFRKMTCRCSTDFKGICKSFYVLWIIQGRCFNHTEVPRKWDCLMLMGMFFNEVLLALENLVFSGTKGRPSTALYNVAVASWWLFVFGRHDVRIPHPWSQSYAGISGQWISQELEVIVI